jgi:hypothetical protein
MKVWTHPATKKLYMVAAAYLDTRDEKMTCYAMSDEDTRLLRLTIDEYNALTYRYFKEDGEAPRPEKKWEPDPVGGGPIVTSG